jgi:hypothetical protein
MLEIINAYKILIGKPEEKSPLGGLLRVEMVEQY